MIYFDFPRAKSHIEVTINDDMLTSVLGPSYKWSDALGEVIEGMIVIRDVIRVRNAQALQELIQRDYIRAEYLNLTVAPTAFRPVTIIMTGNRGQDAAAADAELARQLGYRPFYGGYTWHHMENIRQVGGRWQCQMCLVESGYHRRHPHKGGVYLYELYNPGRKYT